MTVLRAAPAEAPRPRRQAAVPRTTSARRLRRATCGWLVLALLVTGCSVARKANDARPEPTRPVLPLPTAVAPPQAEGLDGTAGEPARHACAVVAAKTLTTARAWKANPSSWNDGGLPSLDLCTLMVGRTPVVIGVSALPAQPNAVDRLATAAGFSEPATALGPSATTLGAEARSGPTGVVYLADDRVVRISAETELPAGELLHIAESVRTVVPEVIRKARQTDAACQLANSRAEKFLGVQVQLRRDYRVNGALTCIWGTFDATVSIVESFHQDSIPEARSTPPPKAAPIGRPGYYLPERGELVFRQGRRVVRVSSITDPPHQVPLQTLMDLVGPLMPLFIR